MVLEEIAARDSLTIPEMLNSLYQEALDIGHDINNFTSFLRVCAMRFISLQLAGDIPTDKDVSIASLDAETILGLENQRNKPLFAVLTSPRNSTLVTGTLGTQP